MSNREDGYCVTLKEQKNLPCKFGVDIGFVRNFLTELSSKIEPQVSATKTQNIIYNELKTVMSSESGRFS